MKYDFDRIIDRCNTRSYKWDLVEKIYGYKDLLPLWVADMDFLVPEEISEALRERTKHGIYGYTGKSPELFQSIKNWFHKRYHWDFQEDWISFTTGVVSGVNLAVQVFTKPGDKVIVQPPVYRPFFTAINNNGRQLVCNPLKLENNRYVMDFNDLQDKFDSRTRMIILCNPHNPGGRVWSRDELLQLAEICQKHDVLILADEIHADFVYAGRSYIPMASLSDEIAQQTITCVAPNKTFNLAGLNTACTIIANKQLREDFETMLENSGIQVNLFGLIAMEAAYTHGEPWLEELLAYLTANLEFLLEFFQTRIPKIKPMKPEGTFLVWLDCRQLDLASEELTELMTNKAKVALNEGSWFGSGGEGFLRLNFACPREILKRGLERIEKAVNSL